MKIFVPMVLSAILVSYLMFTGCSFDKSARPDESGMKQQSDSANRVGGPGSLPPAYLRVKDFKKCLGTQKQGMAEMLCMPKLKPAACPDYSWQQLQGQSIPSCKLVSN